MAQAITKLKLLFISLVFLGLFFPTYYHLYRRFTDPGTYYSHGFIIPLISLYLVWAKRQKLKALALKPSAGGFFVLLAGVILHLFGVIFQVNFCSYLAMIIILAGLILYLGGPAILRQLLFPLAFLLFMMPLPEVVIIGIAFKMKIIAAQLGAWVVNSLGIPTTREGSTVYLPNAKLLIGDPCSGLRSLISFFSLGVLFTQFCEALPFKKWLLVIATVPIAILSNVARIILLLVAAYIYGEKAALGFFHDFTGFMVFVLGFIGFIGVSKLLKCRLTTAIT